MGKLEVCFETPGTSRVLTLTSLLIHTLKVYSFNCCDPLVLAVTTIRIYVKRELNAVLCCVPLGKSLTH